jgi:hypothetical protein
VTLGKAGHAFLDMAHARAGALKNEKSGLSGTLLISSFWTAYTDWGRSSEFRRRQRSTIEINSAEYRPRKARKTFGILSSFRRWSDSCGGSPDIQA